MMRRRDFITLLGGAAAWPIGQTPAVAQTFITYSCLDGSEFVVAFFAGERSAHLQLDGKAMSLPQRLSLSGTRYAKGDITLRITRSLLSSAGRDRPNVPLRDCSIAVPPTLLGIADK
jgi:membrane-bound inhibitor of C-type lysozyme